MVTLRLVARSVKLAPQARRQKPLKSFGRPLSRACGGRRLPAAHGSAEASHSQTQTDSDSQSRKLCRLPAWPVTVLMSCLEIRSAMPWAGQSWPGAHGQGQAAEAAEAAEGMAGGRAGALNHLRSQSRQPGAWRPCRSGLPR